MTSSSSAAVELRAGELRLALRPDLGGAVAGLWHGGEQVLRSVEPAALKGPRLGGCFPLAPYSNRLGYRRLRWQGRDYTTEPNFEGSPHSLHGCAWTEAWRAGACSESRAELTLSHRADGHWPFAFDLVQVFELQADALTVRLAFTSIDARTQPVGLGWHPYFPKRSRSRLHVECSGRWESDPATQLPSRHLPQAGIDAEVRHLDFDHCFDGWRGGARLRDERFSLTLTSSCERLVVFTPPTRDYFCVEPVSHVNNAIHMVTPESHGLVPLAAGQTLEAWMTLRIQRL